MWDAIWEHLSEHGPTYMLIVAAALVQSFKGARWLEARFNHINGDLGEVKNCIVDSGVGKMVEKTDGKGRRLVAAVTLHEHHREGDK
jgi:hypothetical protein